MNPAEVAQADDEIRSTLEAPDLADEAARFFLWRAHVVNLQSMQNEGMTEEKKRAATRTRLRVKESSLNKAASSVTCFSPSRTLLLSHHVASRRRHQRWFSPPKDPTSKPGNEGVDLCFLQETWAWTCHMWVRMSPESGIRRRIQGQHGRNETWHRDKEKLLPPWTAQQKFRVSVAMRYPGMGVGRLPREECNAVVDTWQG
jgi:hypothetical protein